MTINRTHILSWWGDNALPAHPTMQTDAPHFLPMFLVAHAPPRLFFISGWWLWLLWQCPGPVSNSRESWQLLTGLSWHFLTSGKPPVHWDLPLCCRSSQLQSNSPWLKVHTIVLTHLVLPHWRVVLPRIQTSIAYSYSSIPIGFSHKLDMVVEGWMNSCNHPLIFQSLIWQSQPLLVQYCNQCSTGIAASTDQNHSCSSTTNTHSKRLGK